MWPYRNKTGTLSLKLNSTKLSKYPQMSCENSRRPRGSGRDPTCLLNHQRNWPLISGYAHYPGIPDYP